MNKFTVSIVALAAFSASLVSASAESLERPETGGIWTGIYAGVHGGYSWAESSSTAVGERLIQLIDNFPITESDFDANPEGAFGGIQFGYNHELGSDFLIGLEATISAGELSDTFADPASQNPDDTITSQIDWQASLRARAGIIIGSSLVYGTGGISLGEASISMTAPLLANENANLTGWVAGGGVEHMLTDNISIKAEYLYTSFGSQTWFSEDVNGLNYALSADLDVQSLNIGLNFHF